jgi:hypothetical protein
MRRFLTRLAAQLAILALLIQAGLPLADAALHRDGAHGTPTLDITAAAEEAVETLASGDPAHRLHDCPICAFIETFGGATAPSSSFSPLEPGASRASGPSTTPIARSAARFDAQPRAPPPGV